MVHFIQLDREKNRNRSIQIVAGYILYHIVEHTFGIWDDIFQQRDQLRVPGLPNEQNNEYAAAFVDIFQHTKHSMVNVLDGVYRDLGFRATTEVHLSTSAVLSTHQDCVPRMVFFTHQKQWIDAYLQFISYQKSRLRLTDSVN